jgi:drug/metabolite transporter (DMT)-like permease
VSEPAVLASQASVVGMVISFLVLGERLSRRHLAGIGALLTGVALVAATR